MGERPNILWFCTDQQRHDTIACLGNPHVRTPNVDCLARLGTERDPGEFVNLWDDPGEGALRADLLRRHFDAMMATSDAGPARTHSY